MSQFGGRAKFSHFLVAALGILAKLTVAVALLAILRNYFALDIRFSHARPLVEVQLIVQDNLPHLSISNLLKYAGDFLNPHS